MEKTWTAAEELRRARAARGLTQRAAADLFAVAEGAYGDWERGKTSPRPSQRVRMVELFDLAPEVVGLEVPANMELVGSKHVDERFDAIERLLQEIRELQKRSAPR